MSVTEADYLDVSDDLWPANPKFYTTSWHTWTGEISVELEYDDIDRLIGLVYAVMDAVHSPNGDDEWQALLNELGHIQRHTMPEYREALRRRRIAIKKDLAERHAAEDAAAKAESN